MRLKDKTVLITGGASGIGKIMGRKALEKGAKQLIIWDINETSMDAVKKEFSALGKVATYKVDVSDLAQIKSAAAQVKKNEGFVDVLINNAGIIVGKYFHEHTEQDIQMSMDINATAPIYIAQEFLSDMIEHNSGHICNIASSAGLISNPKMSLYVASKWAVTGWSDSLRIEMKTLRKNIKVTTVTPYYISTGMFAGVKSLVPIIKPETAARKIIKGIERNKTFVSMPWSLHFVRFSQGILPIRCFDWIVGDLMGVYKTMDKFTGRGK